MVITYTLGIDEAGRGPLAGPVAIGIVKIHKDYYKKIEKLVSEIKGKDSKKLKEAERERWFKKIKMWKKEGILDFHVALVSNTIIDSKGISFAIKKGIAECLKKVQAFGFKDIEKYKEYFIKLDGSLKAPEVYKQQITIIKGDEKEWIISLASIAAKVTRDEYMKKLCEKQPEAYGLYKFDVHKGYGTFLHRKAIKTYGLSDIHRASFCKNAIA